MTSASPYLLQHADNPVDWYPWGEEAFAEAKRRDVPIFLSVGYSACHWCHVMAHESFENPAVAALMNEYFVNIKVDREELPAVDALYMEATQVMTGQGGWPMSVWLDHDRQPWYAGTYFPPRPSHGMPSFTQVMLALNDTWTKERERVSDSTERIMEMMERRNEFVKLTGNEFTPEEVFEVVESGVHSLTSAFDPINGGFGDAPKFPPSLVLEFLLRLESLNSMSGRQGDTRIMSMVKSTCDRMARGGIYDQIGGGFARYSVDATWTVPHFEKMLYDNAQLLSIYAHLYRLTGDEQALRITTETAEFMLRELLTPEGGFASALDADSEDAEGNSHEGEFYAWTPEQLIAALGPEDGLYASKLGNVTAQGTFENGKSVFTMLADPDDWDRWNRIRSTLYEFRGNRKAPGRDEKIVASWNGLAIRALLDAGSICSNTNWVQAATKAADLLVSKHLGANEEFPNRLVRVSRDGNPGIHAMGVLEDQALVASAFLSLAQVHGDSSWLELAKILLEDIRQHFMQEGGLVDSADDVAPVTATAAARHVDPTDNVTPSGWSATVEAALTYSALTGDLEMRAWAEQLMAALLPLVESHARFAGWGGAVLTNWLDGPREVAIVGDSRSELVDVVSKGCAPGLVYSWGSELPLMENRIRVSDLDTAYVCKNFVCDAPTTQVEQLKQAVDYRLG
jgi:uncharacterized protein YyaL (SSP411 family)